MTNLKQTIAETIEEFDEKFFQDKTGERVDGYLAMNTGKWACLEEIGDNREYCKIAIPQDIKEFIENAIKKAVKITADELRVERDEKINFYFGTGWNLAIQAQEEKSKLFME